jgi:hypothetical protein
MGLICLLLLVERPLPGVLDTQYGSENHQFVQGPLFTSFDQHSRQARIEREFRHHIPRGCQPAMIIDRSQLS